MIFKSCDLDYAHILMFRLRTIKNPMGLAWTLIAVHKDPNNFSLGMLHSTDETKLAILYFYI